MPEVCEVTLTAQILEHKVKNHAIVKCTILSGRYTKHLPTNWHEFQKNMPYNIKAIRNKGKFLWFSLFHHQDIEVNKMYIWNTFGLTGMWGFTKSKSSHIEFELDNGFKFWYSDSRNFGTMIFNPSRPETLAKVKSLAPDFLQSDNWNVAKAKKYNQQLVVILMDQKKIGSGLGNYLVAEILYRTKISPYQICSNMSEHQITSLTYWIKYVTKLCYINNHTGYMRYFEGEQDKIVKRDYHPDVIIPAGTEFQFDVYRRDVDSLGNKVLGDKIIKGRTTYWVPEVQKIVK
jgi:formamidopyrimidine-DNA glycosylase